MTDGRFWCPTCGKNDSVPHTPIDHPWLLKGHRLIPKPKVDEMVAAAVTAERARIRAAVEGLVPNLDYQVEQLDGRLRPMRTPADGWECCQSAVLAAIDGEMT